MKIRQIIFGKARRTLGLFRRTLGLFRESYLDAVRFYKASAVTRDRFGNSQAHLESDIIRLYHVAEKSLSMPEFRPRAAMEVVKNLHQSLQKWDGPIGPHLISGWSVLAAYQAKHDKLGVDISDILPALLEIPPQYVCDQGTRGGVKPYQPQGAEDRAAFLRVIRNRVSVRHFDPTRIPDQAVLERAVSAAMSSPSVCNRQTWKAHCFHGEKAQELLSLQNGNRGFGHTIPTVFVITSDLRLFIGTSERYQSWIDGGMFAMCLLLGLHAEGLGAVALNWSVLNKRDRELRKAASIPGHERIMMLIGCGYPFEGASVPVSTRRALSEVFISHDS